jgi:predicted aconitase with swiveling domain
MIQAQVLIAGTVEGELIVSAEPLSFWGGYDPNTGEITDRRHPLSGTVAAGKILALPFTRGSSTTTAVLLEAQRQGNAPRALITCGVDAFLSLASIVADEMYAQPIPIFALQETEFKQLKHGTMIRLDELGFLRVLTGEDRE